MLHIIRHSSKRHSLQIIALICMLSPRFGQYKKTSNTAMQQRKMHTLALKNKKDRPQRQPSWPHVSVILDSHARCNELAAVNCSEHSLLITRCSCGCSCSCSFKIMNYSYRCSFKIMRCFCSLGLKTIWLAL